MTNNQWNDLKAFLDGKRLDYTPTGFIIDSPWLPGWNQISNIEYYSSDQLWWETNLKAIKLFPETWFIPGFWSEYGMCTEPSAFGARMVWSETNLPHAEKVLSSIEEVDKLIRPSVKSDGLLPFMIGRLQTFEPKIVEAGHNIRFAVSRGPHNIASFLMGTTEFMLALMMDPVKTHELLRLITNFIVSWLKYQIKCFPSIEGLLILDDIIGFVGEHEFKDFVVPYMKEIFTVGKLPVRCLHNDAKGLITAAYLQEMNVNIFNFSFEHSNREIYKLAGDEVALLGNIPPRDVMSLGTAEDVRAWIKREYNNTPVEARVIWSIGGGMAQGTPTENIRAFINEIESIRK